MVANFVGLTLILGGESILAERAIAGILKSHSGASITTLAASELELGQITDALAPSLFGDARVVVVREIQDLTADTGEEILGYLTNPEAGVELVLWHKGGVKGKALLEKVKKLNPVIVAADTLKKESDKSDFVRSEFIRLGRKISVDAVQALVDSLGSDMRELSGVCSQLAGDVADAKTIDAGEVAKFQQGRVETTGFDVADAAMEGKVDQALITLRQAIATGVDPVLITSALAASIRTLAKVSGAKRGESAFALASSLGLPPWQIEKARRQLAGWTPSTLARAVIAVAHADAQIKGAAADPIYALEKAVLAVSLARSSV